MGVRLWFIPYGSTVIVIGGLKLGGLNKTSIMCTEKISPVEILTIHGLSMLRDAQNFLTAYSSYR